jgi:hypothetical protein
VKVVSVCHVGKMTKRCNTSLREVNKGQSRPQGPLLFAIITDPVSIQRSVVKMMGDACKDTQEKEGDHGYW